MKLFVCYGTFGPADRPGRREVKRLSDNHKVPTLILDDGTMVRPE